MDETPYIDEDNTSLDTEFIQHIMHIKVKHQLATPATGPSTSADPRSFMYTMPIDNEPKKIENPQCCAYVWDTTVQSERRCRCKQLTSQQGAFRGCKIHSEEYSQMVGQKSTACKDAEQLYASFDPKETRQHEAKLLLRKIYLCIEYRVTIMYRYFHPQTDCERKLRGHVGALDWFTPDKLQSIYSKAVEIPESKSKVLNKEEEWEVLNESPTSKKSLQMLPPDVESEEDDAMLLWNTVVEYMKDRDSLHSTYGQIIQSFRFDESLISKIEYDPRFEMRVLFYQDDSDERIIDTQEDKIIGFTIKDVSNEDLQYIPEENNYKDKKLYEFTLSLTRELQVSSPANCVLIAIKRTYERLDGKLAFTHNLLFCMFQKNGIIGLGYWLFNKEEAYQPKNRNLKLFGFTTQFICHALGNLIDSPDSYAIHKKVVLVDLNKTEYNGKIATVTRKLENSADGTLYFQVKYADRYLKVKMKNMIPKPLYYLALTNMMISPRFGRGNIIVCKANESGIQGMRRILHTECFTNLSAGANLKVHEQVVHEILCGNELECQIQRIGSVRDRNPDIVPSSSTSNIHMNYPVSMLVDLTFSNYNSIYKNPYTNIDSGKVKHESHAKESHIKKHIVQEHLSASNIKQKFHVAEKKQ